MKNYNGYGTIVKMSGKRRKPYRVTVTIGYDPESKKQVRKNIGYFATRKEASQFLAEYNASPYDLTGLTFKAVYERWAKDYDKTLQPYATAFSRCKDLWDMPMSSIRVAHLESVLDSLTCANSAISLVKGLFNHLFKYALRYEIVNKNYALLCRTVSQDKAVREGIPYSQEEEEKLWNYDGNTTPYILIGIYSGWRIRELLDLEIKDGCMWGGSKTEAGKNRCVPIHPKIQKLCENYSPWTSGYYTFRKFFGIEMKELGMENHMPNDCRHTFATRCDEAGIRDAVRKQLMGHRTRDVTEKHYTHRTIETLRAEIEKL